MNAPTISDRILRLEQLALRARVSLDLWIALDLDTAIEPFSNAIDTYDDFWRFARTDHQDMFFIRVTNLFKRDKRTENFISLIADAYKSKAITAEIASACTAKIAELDDLPGRVALIRNNSAAHQHRTLARNEVFSEAKITVKLMTQYSAVALELSAMLKRAINLEPISETQIVRPADTLAELLAFVEKKLTE